eukprot:354726-Chlamydomonas_euryale.AAC.9
MNAGAGVRHGVGGVGGGEEMCPGTSPARTRTWDACKRNRDGQVASYAVHAREQHPHLDEVVPRRAQKPVAVAVPLDLDAGGQRQRYAAEEAGAFRGGC